MISISEYEEKVQGLKHQKETGHRVFISCGKAYCYNCDWTSKDGLSTKDNFDD